MDSKEENIKFLMLLSYIIICGLLERHFVLEHVKERERERAAKNKLGEDMKILMEFLALCICGTHVDFIACIFLCKHNTMT